MKLPLRVALAGCVLALCGALYALGWSSTLLFEFKGGGGGGGDGGGGGGGAHVLSRDLHLHGAGAQPPVLGVSERLRQQRRRRRASETMHVAVVACGQRVNETLVMAKSAVLFSRKHLHFHIFAERQLHRSFAESLDSWPDEYRRKYNFSVYPITFPKEYAEEWRQLFKPCASQRLFLPTLLADVDSLLYVDTDILFLRAVDDLWAMLPEFTAAQAAAVAPEHEEPRVGWYSRFARHPYYGATGINSGVMLFNLTRVRAATYKNDMSPVELQWDEMLLPLYKKYKLNITWGDQDLLNIIFHHNPEMLRVFPCEWNYRPDHCMYGSSCKGADTHGVYVLHGNRGVYHDDKQPAFRAVYDAIHDFPFDENLFQSLLYPLERQLLATVHTHCGRSSHLFTRQLQRTMRAVYDKMGLAS
ncbi:glucoside xylosyltransferase 1-like [Lethenteron reissneri]|uniref:glucoside xylosyltransferase 1-like n=1 Tax=Lethenteron reissneri TaxID=7753 RepID=UPI002AB799F9|nr:glucoside xylosyltransferase 1-like [Lethenteron reissneri]